MSDSENRALSDIVWTPARGLSEPEIRGISWNNFLLSEETYGGRWRTEAEVRVTPETALQSTVVLACCRILAETISSLPLHVYRRGEDGSKDIARDIPLYRVLSFAPNSWQTKFEFFEQMVMNLCLWGNSYTQIKSGRYGAVSELLNLHPSRMDVERLENGRLRYMYTNPENGRLEPYTQDQIMHVRWTAEPDGIKGMVPVEVARESIALARACEIHAAKFWANSARPGMVLQTDGSLSPEAAERLRDNWERLHRGVDRAYKTAILTNGLKVEPVGFTAEQSQFESTRRFQSEEIARVYRLPLRLVQGQPGGNPEIEGQDFVTYTLVPWLRRIESAISRSLIYNDDLFVAEFDVRGLMRGDSNSRAGYYSTMTNLGIFSINDCRRLENLPPLENGDKHFVGMNMQTIDEAVKPKPDPAMMGGPGAPPPPAQGGVPSLPEVKTGKAPNPAEKGEQSKPKEEGMLVSYGEGKTGRVKHVMEQGTLDLKSGEKIEVQPGEPVALVVDEETGEEAGIKVSQLKPIQEKRALSQQNQALYDAQEEIVKKSGRWPQQGPSGAHYMEKNPFASRGIACRNCIYYEEGGSCEIVKGIISPNAICKLWIIPEEKLSMPESRDCGTGAGGFKDGNKCAGSSDDGEPVRGFRRGEGDKKQSRAAKKLYQMGTSERRIKDLVRQLGGKPGRSSAKVTGDKIGIRVRDSSGKDIFYVEMGYNGAGIVPIGKTLSREQASQIESLAKPAFPDKISDRLYNRGKRYPVSVHRDDAVLKTGGRIAKKGKQQRAYCPTGEGGGIDNSCGSTTETAKARDNRLSREANAIKGPIAANDERLAAKVDFKPVAESSKNSDSIPMASDDAIRLALSGNVKIDGQEIPKRELVGSHRELAEGTPVALRIDIPAYEKKDTYAVTVHSKAKSKNGVGKVIGFDSIVTLSGDVTFVSHEPTATAIAMGRSKTPLATVVGKFKPSREVPEDINDWTAVGYNPKKAAYFYDKRTGREVTGGTDSVSIGNTVFVRTPKYGERYASEQYRSLDDNSWGLEQRAEDCGRVDGGLFGPGNNCAADGEGGSKSDRIAEMAIKSMAETGGFSIHPVSESSPTSGYMVSVAPESETIVPSAQKVTGPVIDKFLKENKSKFEERPTLHIGGWIDSESNQVYLDLSERFDDIDDAIDAAESTNQLAIWDLNEKKEIRKGDYSGRRTKGKGETRAVRLSDGSEGGRDRGGHRGGSREDHGREGRQAADALVEELKQSGEADLPSIVFRPTTESRSVVEYDLDTDAIYVSDSLNDEAVASFRLAAARGWLSQPNPLLHELAHRHHAVADAESYDASASLSFDAENRDVAKSVSRYAATSHREFVAEVLAGLWAGKEYGDDVMRLLSSVTNGKFST